MSSRATGADGGAAAERARAYLLVADIGVYMMLTAAALVLLAAAVSAAGYSFARIIATRARPSTDSASRISRPPMI